MRSVSSTATTGCSCERVRARNLDEANTYPVNLVARFKVLGGHKDRPLHLLCWVRGVVDRHSLNLDVHLLRRKIIVVFFKQRG